MIYSKKKADEAAYLFHQGTNYHASEYLGAHVVRRGWYSGVQFRVWAPNAASVSVIGEWNGWDAAACPMERVTEDGVWERFVPEAAAHMLYKYTVRTADGQTLEKNDPYAFSAELRPGTASRVWELEQFPWQDADWMTGRCRKDPLAGPMNIYELHVGSWRRTDENEPFGYVQLADALIPYLLDMGYNYVELLPLCEHPLDGSWGYQTTGYFAPTSRYGTPQELMTFIDRCHLAGIGVLLDWVPSHFPKNTDSLARFDGQPCYEYRDPDKGEHKQWGTLVFDYGRNEVQSFLISSALFWLEKYHLDGLRVDAVASMLYLDYMREPGEWKPNDRGGNDHAEAVAFLQKLNATVREAVPSALMIAEESSNWGGVTDPEGLGFRLKWNMGWMNDLLEYIQADPVYRGAMHNKLTFQLTYAFQEHYILPISHDEVVHGKKSLLDKMPGSYEQKFAGMRLFLLYMYTQPGKKLLFMGQEFGQFIEWDYKKGLDWLLLDYDAHRLLQTFDRDLNRLYLQSPALWNDGGWDGFQWIDCQDVFGNVIVYRRIGKEGGEQLVLCNFSNNYYESYRIGVPAPGVYRELLNTDDLRYGGGGVQNGMRRAENVPCHDLPQSICLRVAPLSAVLLDFLADAPSPEQEDGADGTDAAQEDAWAQRFAEKDRLQAEALRAAEAPRRKPGRPRKKGSPEDASAL